MASFKRKRRRNAQKIAGKSIVGKGIANMVLTKIDENCEKDRKAQEAAIRQTAEEAYQKLQQKAIPDLWSQITAYFWAWLAFDKGHTGDWIARNFLAFNEFIDVLERDKMPIGEIYQSLKEEKGVDFANLMLLAQKQKQDNDKEFNQTRRRLLKSGAIT